MSGKSYNGWTNYETWLVNLWLDEEDSKAELWDKVDMTQADAVRELATVIEDSVIDRVDEMGIENGMVRDLIGSALSEVNWDEIARSMVE